MSRWRRRPPMIDRARRALVAMAFLGVGGTALADPEDPLRLTVGSAIRHDDNLFRLPANAAETIGQPKASDRVVAASVGLQWRKQYSLQAFELDATASRYRHDRYSFLDFSAQDYRGQWRWQWTPRLTGSLLFDRQQTLASFADYRSFSGRNLRTIENQGGDADWWLHGSWHLLAGVRETRVRNEQQNRAEDDYRLRSFEAGGKYLAESGAALTLVARDSRGEYSRDIDSAAFLSNRFSQSEQEVRVAWPLSGKSSLSGRLAHVSRRHESMPQRDYAGTTGRLDYLWLPSGKLELKLATARDIASYQDAFGSYYVNDSVAASPAWLLDSRLTVRGRIETSRRSFRGAPAPVDSVREDHGRQAQIGVDWTPTRAWLVSGVLRQEQRKSSHADLEYRATTAGISAQWTF